MGSPVRQLSLETLTDGVLPVNALLSSCSTMMRIVMECRDSPARIDSGVYKKRVVDHVIKYFLPGNPGFSIQKYLPGKGRSPIVV